MSRGLHVAAAFVVAGTGVARAGSTHKITIETDPAGAHVYLNDVDSGAVCDKTPCSFDAPVGSYPIIVQLQNYAPKIDQLDVPKRPKKPLIFKYKLDPAIGTLVFDAPATLKGATISVDDVDKGKLTASSRVDIEPGGHHVVISLNGKTLFEDIVNVETGDEVPIKVTASAAASKTVATAEPGNGEESATTTPPDASSVTTTAAPAKHGRYIAGDVVVDVGFRRFSYTNATSGPLAPESEDGQVLAGPAIEVWPSELVGWDHLRELSLYIRLELPLNHQSVVDAASQSIGTTTNWFSFEASLKQRWTLADTAALEVSGGYVRDVLGFSGDAGDLMKLPDADYQSVRLGARGSMLLGAIEPYVAVETRVVESGGALPARFQSASATGYRGAVGIAAHGGSFVGRVEACDVHYDWTLAQASQPGFYSADGATDKVFGVSVMLGYQY